MGIQCSPIKDTLNNKNNCLISQAKLAPTKFLNAATGEKLIYHRMPEFRCIKVESSKRLLVLSQENSLLPNFLILRLLLLQYFYGKLSVIKLLKTTKSKTMKTSIPIDWLKRENICP